MDIRNILERNYDRAPAWMSSKIKMLKIVYRFPQMYIEGGAPEEGICVKIIFPQFFNVQDDESISRTPVEAKKNEFLS